MTGVQTCALPIYRSYHRRRDLTARLIPGSTAGQTSAQRGFARTRYPTSCAPAWLAMLTPDLVRTDAHLVRNPHVNKIGRVSCRERGCKFASYSVGAAILNK